MWLTAPVRSIEVRPLIHPTATEEAKTRMFRERCDGSNHLSRLLILNVKLIHLRPYMLAGLKV